MGLPVELSTRTGTCMCAAKSLAAAASLGKLPRLLRWAFHCHNPVLQSCLTNEYLDMGTVCVDRLVKVEYEQIRGC